MTTEVILHYRPYESETTQLPKIAEKAIQDFPTRPLSRFIPWFPHDGSRLPLKPKRLPPVISEEATEDVRQYLTISEHDIKLQSYDCTVDRSGELWVVLVVLELLLSLFCLTLKSTCFYDKL